MLPHYQTLQTIYEIVKHDSRPHTYWCSPREIIVRQLLGWDIVEQHLHELVNEGLAECKNLGTYAYRMTLEGLEKARSLSQKSPVFH